MEYLKSVIPVIESNYVNFTTVERSIADFFIYNREQMDFSAKSVAGKLFVSEASLSRFAKMRIQGLQEFIYQYEENFVVRQDSMTGNTRTVLNAYQELLNKTYNLVNEKQMRGCAGIWPRQDACLSAEQEVQAWPPGRWSCVSCVSVWTSRPWNTAT